MGNISLDGSKIHADASKSKAVSYGYLPKLTARLQAEVEELLVLANKPIRLTCRPDWILRPNSAFVRSGWSTWPKPRGFWKHEPKKDMTLSRPSMRRNWANETSRLRRAATNRVVGCLSRLCREHDPAINTISRTRTRGL